jgi:mycothiol synthase
MPMLDRTIRMDGPPLTDIPEPQLPPGYELRAGAENLAETWVRAINAAFGDKDPWTVERFEASFANQPQFDPEGFFFVWHGDEPVATAFAWRDAPEEDTWGRVHWVGVTPEHRGKGLARAVVTAVMRHHAARGMKRVFLETQGFRQPAIRLYLSLGFRPAPRNEEEEAIWERVMGEVTGGTR